MLSKFNNKKHRRLTALLLCVALMLGSVTSVSADISAADSETEVQSGAQTYTEEPTAEAVSYEAPETQAEVQEETSVAEETEAPAADTQQTEAHTEAATEAHTETAAETQVAETTETEVETETETEVVAQQLEYEDDQVKVHVTASEEGIIPDHASLKVVPLVKQEVTNEMTDEQKQEVEAINKKYDEAEKKLTEKAEKEAYDIAGFLAYDISLVDADGNKVEPNGDVKVTMDYKQPVIAEDAVQTVNDTEWLNSTKDLDVTVLHLEEDNKGKVTDVVDMTAEDTNGDAEINTTSENEIQKVTITTNSFSTFAITYSNYSLTVKYVDQNGADITSDQFTQNVSIGKGEELKISNGDKVKIPETVTIDNKTYRYSGAHLDKVSGENVYSVKVNKSGEWKYKEKPDGSNEKWNKGKGGIIYLVYQEQTQEQPTALPTVGTIDSTSKGITMRMINYDSPADGLSNDIGGPYTVDGVTGSIKQNLLKRVLTEGYPVTVGGTSLKKLFTGGTNVNHLFLQSSFDADGSYEYSSFKNYAHLEDNGNFTVYDALGTPSDENARWYQRGNFMPYNSISASGVSKNKNLYDESGNELSASDPANGKTLYKTQGTNDYYFGMYVEADFNQPKDGQLTKGSDMVYEFNGDDDLWVYVDGVLMLDIGGIHDAHSGSINFATGDITYDSMPGTTIKAQFQTAGVFPDGSAWDDSRVSEFFNGNTLKDFTEHNFKMFYMERGAGASNLKMKFNLEVIPTYEVNFNKVDTQGAGLAGAKFEIRDDSDSSKVYNVTSGSDGGVSVRLHEGEYTMTETQAPTGYLAASGTWKIKVNSDGTYTIKKNGEEIAKDSNNVYKIVNKGQHEDAEANLITSKTVKATKYDKREYEITLGASTSGREAGTEAKAASVVLVLDRSGSMGSDGMTALVNAADTFIDTLKTASPDSQVAVVYFNGTQGSNTDKTIAKNFTKLDTNQKVKSIKDFLTTYQNPSGGTPMGDALKKAKSLLDTDNSGNQKYVLFFTDGLPGHSSDDAFNCMVANSAVNYATDIKVNATIYTVGYNLSGSGTLYWHRGDSATSSDDRDHGYYYNYWGGGYKNHDLSTSASDFLKDYIATSVQEGSNKKYAYTVDNTEDLGKEFKKLAAQIGAYYSINAEKIVDVIDARFELTEAGRKALVGDVKATTNEDGSKTYVKKETGKDGAVVGTVKITENTDGTTTIEWTGTEAHIGNKDNLEDPAWERKIGVVAKADFIGGNAVTTNTEDSGVFVNENTTKMFPKPTVNVKALSLEITGKAITVYKGDALQPQAYYNQLAQTINVVELDGATKTLTGVKPVNNKTQVSLPALTDAQKDELENNKTLTIGDGDNPKYKYIYPGTSDAVGYFKYIYTIPETPGGNIHDHTAGNAANPAEKYHLEVVFVPYTVEQRVAQNSGITDPALDGGTEVSGNLTASADYIVNIIDGSIEITKVLETEPKGENGDTFTFTVTGPNNFSQDVSVTVTKDSLVNGRYTATYTGDELKHLARGEYTVTEKVAAGYDVKRIENDANATNTKYVLNNPDNIHFTMGTVVENNKDVDVIKNYTYNSKDGGTLGKAIFTNEPVYSDWQIIKVSASSHDVRLAGAIFELQSTTDTNVKYYGKSGDAGIVEWYQKYQNNDVSDELTGKLPTGTYTLKEIKAPTGYTLSSNTYTLQITKTGALKTVQLNGENVTPALQNGKYQILIENAVIYNLPNSGGSGIYWFSICGMLLMMAAAWIIYKNKCREVLVK